MEIKPEKPRSKSIAQSLHEKYKSHIPVAQEGVMKFKDCLRRIIGRRSYGDNLPIFKAYWRHTLKSIAEQNGYGDNLPIFKAYWRHTLKSIAVQNGYPIHQQPDEYIEERVLEIIEIFKRPQGVDISFFRKFSAEIPAWRKEHRMKPQRQAAAKSRWLKEKMKKSVDSDAEAGK